MEPIKRREGMSNLIRANKCVLGETYYLTGMWYDYNIKPISYIPYITSKGNKPLINTPVIFVGRDKNGSHGKHRFMFADGSERYIKMYASDDLFIKPMDNPDILKEGNVKTNTKRKATTPKPKVGYLGTKRKEGTRETEMTAFLNEKNIPTYTDDLKEHLISKGFTINEDFDDLWSYGIKFDNGYSIEMNSANKVWIHLESGFNVDNVISICDLTDIDSMDRIIDIFKKLPKQQ